jgi:two-component system, LytTR family, sensor histidine kinase LytS
MINPSLFNNIIEYFYRFSFFIVLLFLLAQYTPFNKLFYRKVLTKKQEFFVIGFSGIISIISFMIFREAGAPLYLPFFFGVYSGMGVGLGTSVILAIYIYTEGQPLFTVVLCLLAGPLGALLGAKILPGQRKPFYIPFIAGIITLIGFCKDETPFVELIPTMISNNSLWFVYILIYLSIYVAGCYLLLSLLEVMVSDEDKRKALQTNYILSLVGNALDQLRQGVSEENVQTLCQNLERALDIPGVCIITKERCLYYPRSHVHSYPQESETFRNIKRRIFEEGLVFEGDHRLIFGNCPDDCEFTNIFLLPLNDGQKVVEALGFIQSKRQAFSGSDQNMATGLALIFSSELTRSKMDEQKIALESAKFKLLQAQINPHFLFNSLNTIAWMTGKDAAKAEELILHLSNFLRQSFDQKGDFVTLKKEIEYLKSYLFIEKARFMEKLKIEYTVDESVLSYYIPPFLIQPLVENSIKHGISKKKEGGTVHIVVQPDGNMIKVAVSDDGNGCTPERLEEIFHPPAFEREDAPRRGIGVLNVKERVTALFGQESKFEMKSKVSEGTTVSFYLPQKGGSWA